MNSNALWNTYNLFYKRKVKQYTPVFYKVLQDQIKHFAVTRNLDTIPIVPTVDALRQLYADAGPKWAYFTYRYVIKDAFAHGKKMALAAPRYKVDRLPVPGAGRMPIGLDQAFLDAMYQFFGTDFLNTASDIAETTKDFIRQQIEEGLQRGEDLDYIIRNIQRSGFTVKRAALIARTETTKASNYGEQAGTDQTGLETKKEWIAVRDNRTRRDHVMTDGQVREDGKPFHVGVERWTMQRPGDGKDERGLKVPAKEICNCRCVVGRIVLTDSDGLPMMKPGPKLVNR